MPAYDQDDGPLQANDENRFDNALQFSLGDFTECHQGDDAIEFENALLFGHQEHIEGVAGDDFVEYSVEDFLKVLEGSSAPNPEPTTTTTTISLPPASSSSFRPIAPRPPYQCHLVSNFRPQMLPSTPILIAQGNKTVQKRPRESPESSKKGKKRATLTEEDELSDLTKEQLITEVLRLRKENQALAKRLDDFANTSKPNMFLVTLWEENQYMKECLAVHQSLPAVNLTWVKDGWDYYTGLQGRQGELYDFFFILFFIFKTNKVTIK